MSEGWAPDISTRALIEQLIDTLLRELPKLLGVDEIIPGCEVIDVDPAGVGVGVLPRYIRVRIHRYYQDVLYRGGLTFIAGDYVTVVRIREGDNHEVLGAGGAGGVVSADHGSLAGLIPDDDHTQYLLADGTRDLSGTLTITTGIILTGATGVNRLQVPDNVALAFHIEDAGLDGSDYFAIISLDAGRVVVVNRDTADIDFIVSSFLEANLFRVDAGTNTVRLGDWDTNYFETDNVGDSMWVGGGGLPFGSCYGMEIGWIQANAVQNLWYDISDVDMVDGQLHNVTHDGDGQLTVPIAGMYMADWAGAFEADAANVHVQITFSVNGVEIDAGMNHFETVAINREESCSGNAILDLAAADTVNVSIRTTDAGAPDLYVDHLMIRLVQIGGT